MRKKIAKNLNIHITIEFAKKLRQTYRILVLIQLL